MLQTLIGFVFLFCLYSAYLWIVLKLQKHYKHSVCVRCKVMSDSLRPHGLQPARLLRHGIFQARKLEWVAISFSIGPS